MKYEDEVQVRTSSIWLASSQFLFFYMEIKGKILSLILLRSNPPVYFIFVKPLIILYFHTLSHLLKQVFTLRSH